MFADLLRAMLTWGSEADEVATLEKHSINADTDKSFCELCVNQVCRQGRAQACCAARCSRITHSLARTATTA